MDLNIFRIQPDATEGLHHRLEIAGLTATAQLDLGGWTGELLFSENPLPGKIPWITTFTAYIGNGDYSNRSYFAVILLAKDDVQYAISFGKAHFYIRPFCDYDFGTEIAKRLADEDDVAQTSARRYQGKQTKDIRSFGRNSHLDVPPGSSIDFIQGRVINNKREVFGISAKFGTSCLLSPDIPPSEIGTFLSQVEAELSNPTRFKLPRTLVLTSDEEVARYDRKLIHELRSPIEVSSLATDTFDLYGVDFVFSSSGVFTIKCGHLKPLTVERLTMKTIKDYIKKNQLSDQQILRMKIVEEREGDVEFTLGIKEAVDFICDEDRVVLRGGKWLRFNEDYLDQLDAAVRGIEMEEPEEVFREISVEEGAFNSPDHLEPYGYSVADKDFGVLTTKSRTPVEAWDLQRGETVYAVKFGTPQRLNYVVDQAMNVLELLRNGANQEDVPVFRRYCLWLGYRCAKRPSSIAESGSIILKQKVEAWARQCREAGITPVIKISRKIHPTYDTPTKG